MAFSLGKTSKARLDTCDPRLQAVITKANTIMELTVICGARSKEDQDKAYSSGNSKVQWPNSKHNLKEGQRYSNAVDVAPYFLEGKERIDWNDSLAFARLAGVIFAVASEMAVNIRWGGDWDRDFRSRDESFLDIGHFELV